jgi:hypothetical protein
MKKAHRPLFQVMCLSREAQLFVGWVSGSVTHAGVGFHASTQPTFCKHIANAQIQRKLAEISLDLGYELPIICTPYELLGDYNDVAR